MATSDILHRLQTTVATVCALHPVTLAYLFGSHARGDADSESDIDIAILAEPSLSKEERRDLRVSLLLAFTQAFPEHLTEIILLQEMPVLLQVNVIREGSLLFAKNPGLRAGYELGVEAKYDDEAPFLEREASLTVQRILNRQR